VLYVGNANVNMNARMQDRGMDFRYDLPDIRDVESESLLESEHIPDNLLAIPGGVPTTSPKSAVSSVGSAAWSRVAARTRCGNF
jgi:hypothetical protein